MAEHPYTPREKGNSRPILASRRRVACHVPSTTLPSPISYLILCNRLECRYVHIEKRFRLVLSSLDVQVSSPVAHSTAMDTRHRPTTWTSVDHDHDDKRVSGLDTVGPRDADVSEMSTPRRTTMEDIRGDSEHRATGPSGLTSASASVTLPVNNQTPWRKTFLDATGISSVRPFCGIIQDMRARVPYYWSDWTDAWNYRVVPATLLIFFAKCVTSSIASACYV